MFGYLRFALAFFVLISHVGIRFSGLNPGVIAVVIFYILAGHVVSHLWADIIPEGPGKIYGFYRDRVLRIFPLYIYVAVLSVLFLVITDYGKPQFTLLRLIGNLTIIPLNFYMILKSTILTSPEWCLIPPTWSLGAELQAYVLLPLVFSHGFLKILMVFTSFCVYMLANLQIINPDYWGYRLIPGVFFMFVAGASIQRTKSNIPHHSRFDLLSPWIIWLLIAISGIIFQAKNLFAHGYTKETFLGFLIGIPVIYLLDHLPVKLPGNALMGALSYGIFLTHFLVIWWIDYTGFIEKNSLMYIPSITLGSVLIASLGITAIEKHMNSIRKAGG